MARISVKTLFGLERLLAKELEDLGAEDIVTGRRVVYCSGDLELIYRINLSSRLALHVLKPFLSIEATGEETLYNKLMLFDWSKLIRLDQSIAIRGTVHSSMFKHSHYAILRVKDAIVDWFKMHYNERPGIDTENPDIPIDLHISENKINISLDSTGDSLHKRSYRIQNGPAPLNEVLAAGLIMHAGWDGSTDFHDPMCGTGTLSIEAAMIAARIPPAHLRTHFSFMNWQDFDEDCWQKVLSNEHDKIKPPGVRIFASDVVKKQSLDAEKNAIAAGVHDYIRFGAGNFFRSGPIGDSGLVLLNPPYDERMSLHDADNFYSQIGRKLKFDYNGWEAGIISANKQALKRLGLRPSLKITLFNGNLESVFVKFELYKGRRDSMQSDKKLKKR